ncbi:MAG: hypothetical protein P4K94_07280 [Terracidiphilus sp.]|nr:hypothetical protein [Terracidiphilus sp.]
MHKRNASPHKFTRWAAMLLLALLAAGSLRAQQPAHRGGVVDGHSPENSRGAAEDGIHRGYRMLEIDSSVACRRGSVPSPGVQRIRDPMQRENSAYDRHQAPSHLIGFYKSMEDTLRKNGLLSGTYFTGTEEARAYFKGKARISIGEADLEKKVVAGEDVSHDYFLFEHVTTLDAKGVALAHKASIPAVVSVNKDHYRGKNQMK